MFYWILGVGVPVETVSWADNDGRLRKRLLIRIPPASDTRRFSDLLFCALYFAYVSTTVRIDADV